MRNLGHPENVTVYRFDIYLLLLTMALRGVPEKVMWQISFLHLLHWNTAGIENPSAPSAIPWPSHNGGSRSKWGSDLPLPLVSCNPSPRIRLVNVRPSTVLQFVRLPVFALIWLVRLPVSSLLLLVGLESCLLPIHGSVDLPDVPPRQFMVRTLAHQTLHHDHYHYSNIFLVMSTPADLPRVTPHYVS